MIKITKGSSPNKLQTLGARKVRKLCAAYDADSKKYDAGLKQFEFASSIYGHSSVRNALVSAQKGKCCYCEVVIHHPYALYHVEHYRPKAYSQQSKNSKKQFPGYYWLVYDWDNLFLACHFCNSVNKKNFFPLLIKAERAKNHRSNLIAEKPLIIRPDTDPRPHIDFHKEVPIGRTKAGSTTIEVLGLDRREHDERLRLYIQLSRSRELFDEYQADNSKAAKEIVETARSILVSATSPNAPFSAMATSFLDRFPLP